MTISIRPPFTLDTAMAKVRAAEDAWNSREPVRVSLAYSADSIWRNRDQFVHGRGEIQAFLTGKSGPLQARDRPITPASPTSAESLMRGKVKPMPFLDADAGV